jgi:hypothetical protein
MAAGPAAKPTWPLRVARTRQPLEPHTPRSTGPPFLLLLHSASDRTPPPQFILSLLWHSSHRAPPCRLLHFTRGRSPRRPPDRPPPSTFCLLSILGRRHATTSPHFDQNVAAFLRPVSAASTRTPCDLSHPSPLSSSRRTAGPPRSPRGPLEHCHRWEMPSHRPALLPHRRPARSVRAHRPNLARHPSHDSLMLGLSAHLHLASSLAVGWRAAMPGPCAATAASARAVPHRVLGRCRPLRPLGHVS